MGLYLYNNLNDMMSKILNFVCAALLVAGLCGCEKIDVNKLEGTWSEQYDPTVFAMDGSVTYTFDGNGNYQKQDDKCPVWPGMTEKLPLSQARRWRQFVSSTSIS